MAEDKRRIKALLGSVKAVLEELINDPDPDGEEVLHFLGELSIEDVDLSAYPEDEREIKQLLTQAKEHILNWEWLLKGFRSRRKSFPKTHWWWYPEEL